MCGADATGSANVTATLGSPPRVRSRRIADYECRSPGGITSACAEQTIRFTTKIIARRDHLRVCGADMGMPRRTALVQGSPPRVRSRRARVVPQGLGVGITSACAEQTHTM